MIISVASGKGGTGKTTIATNMALALGSGVELLDCDVEEPNAHLFLQPIIERSQRVETPIPLVDESKMHLLQKMLGHLPLQRLGRGGQAGAGLCRTLPQLRRLHAGLP